MSVPFTTGDALAWTGAKLARGSVHREHRGVSIDTRSLAGGELFVAIQGPNHDGHSYLEKAAAAGASGLLVQCDRPLPPGLDAELPVLAVDDTTRGLGALATGHRAGFSGPLVAITGSNGKTTTKEMCAGILSVGAATLKNRGNLNNQYGLPLTLLARTPEQRRAVVELGMNHRGEIAELAGIAQPTIGVVTNVGTAHIEYLGSRAEIAREKGDLLASLPAEGTAVLNAEDDFAGELADRTSARVVTFGRAGAQVCAEDVTTSAGRFAFQLAAPEGSAAVSLAGLGATTVANALAAAAAALAAGAQLDEVVEGLARYQPVPGRLQRREMPGDVVVIDDSYNANPQSMEVALRFLAECEAGGHRVAVLGDMGELGGSADAAHREAGRLTARLGIDFLVAVGAQARRVAAGAAEAGMPRQHIRTADSSEQAGPEVGALLGQGDWVLLKGSRAMKMERVADFLEAERQS